MASLSSLAIGADCRQRHPVLLPHGLLSSARMDGLPSVGRSGQWSKRAKGDAAKSPKPQAVEFP